MIMGKKMLLAAIALSICLSACTLTVPKGDFNITVSTKTASSPTYGLGAANLEYLVNGEAGKVLSLTRGTTYSFSINAPGHPFYLTTSAVGGGSGLSQEWKEGVTGSLAEVGQMTFTPNQNTPSLLYYQCSLHDYMGWKITVSP